MHMKGREEEVIIEQVTLVKTVKVQGGWQILLDQTVGFFVRSRSGRG